VSETRKIAAILVADVVGYSRLAGADEERWRGCAQCAE
jgi:adenylate cyclase